MLNWTKTATYLLLALVLALLFAIEIRQSQQPPIPQPATNENQGGTNSQTPAKNTNAISPISFFLYFLTPDAIQNVANYCANEPDSKPNKWLHDKFICEVRISDVVAAIGSLLLVVVTSGLIVVAAIQIFTTKRQLRAYVYIDIIGIGVWTVPSAPNPIRGPQAGDNPHIYVIIKNSGQTPARKVIHRMIVHIRPVDLHTPPEFLPFGSPGLITSKTEIPPGGKATKRVYLGEIISQSEWDEIVSGNLAIYGFGEIFYRDIFSFFRVRTTKYRVMHFQHSPAGTTELTICDEGNSAT
jgi:hypothetical protein